MHQDRPTRRLRGIFAALGAALAVLLVWQFGIRDHIRPYRFGVVDPGKVYRSGQLTPSVLEGLQARYGIKTIVDLGTYPPGSREDLREQRAVDALGMQRYVFDLEGDATGNPNAYVQALRLMTDPDLQPVLIHCGAGTERTGTAAILYRNIVQGGSIVKAFEEAQTYGHDPYRNPWIFKVLLEFRHEIERAFREGGQIPGVAALPEPAPVEPGGGR